MNPDFEGLGLVEAPETESEEAEERYTEAYHLEDVDKKIIAVYERTKDAMLKFDTGIKVNPQKYYISLRKNKNFAYLELRKKRMHIVIMLPYETGNGLVKRHKLTQLSQGIQKFYNGPCFKVTLENEENFDEILKALEEAYKQQS